MSSYNDCTWYPVIRWVSFFPLAFIASGVAQALLRWANSETPFISEVLSRAAEPWVFFFVSLWVLPRFHRAYIVIISFIYISIYLSTIYFAATKEGFSNQSWADYSISVVAIISCSIAAYYFTKEVYSNDIKNT